ncbi:unnamed protein product [Brassica oleracea var. botrytis]
MLTEEREHKPGLAKREFCPCRECALFTSATIIACERKLVLYTHFRNYACFSKVASVSKKMSFWSVDSEMGLHELKNVIVQYKLIEPKSTTHIVNQSRLRFFQGPGDFSFLK